MLLLLLLLLENALSRMNDDELCFSHIQKVMAFRRRGPQLPYAICRRGKKNKWLAWNGRTGDMMQRNIRQHLGRDCKNHHHS